MDQEKDWGESGVFLCLLGLGVLFAQGQADGLHLAFPGPVSYTHLDVYKRQVQIGARNMQNFQLLKAVGKMHKPVLLKRGLCNTIEEWIMSAEYIMAGGNENVILCERGDVYKRQGEEGGAGEFKQGAFRIAVKTGAPVVPVAITGLSEETLQGDAAILEILRRCGARFTRTGQGVVFEKAPLHGCLLYTSALWCWEP